MRAVFDLRNALLALTALMVALALPACGDSGGDPGPDAVDTDLGGGGSDDTGPGGDGDTGDPGADPDDAGGTTGPGDASGALEDTAGPDTEPVDDATPDAGGGDDAVVPVEDADEGPDALPPGDTDPPSDGGGVGGSGDADEPDDVGFEILGPHCGDGNLDEGEACDDGDENSDTEPDACRTDCSVAGCGDGVADTGETCDDGDLDDSDTCTVLCEPGPDLPKPEPGDVIFTEAMVNPLAIADPAGEWFEVVNLTGEELSLVGCVVRDEGTDIIDINTFGALVTLQPGATALFAHAAGPSPEDGGLDADFEYTTMLLDNLTDELVLECETGIVDVVAYDAESFPIDNGVAMSLDAEAFSAAANDSPLSWCEATAVYGPGAAEGVGDLGSPGVPNEACPPPDVTVDACSLLPPYSYQILDTESVEVVLIYLEDDLTNETNEVDAPSHLIVEVGFGPDGVLPSEDSWGWYGTSPAGNWFNPGGLDSWVGEVTVLGVGEFDVAGRISLDAGETWNYCDAGVDPNDGYIAADTIHVTALEHPCTALACDEAPAPGCASDGVTYTAPLLPDGVCVLDEDDAPVCDYGVETTDCGLTGQVCVEGAIDDGGGCQGTAPGVTEPGSVFVSEIMLLPKLSVIPTGQWLELHNASDGPLDLQGCEVVSGGASVTVDVPLVIGPGARRVLGSSNVTGANGGAEVQFEWGNELEWSAIGGDLTLRCGGVDIDTFEWTSADWPIVAGAALSLSPFAFSAGDNDAPASWCAAPEAFGAGDTGSPGVANPPCPGDVNPIEFCIVAASGFIEAPAGEPVPLIAWIVDDGLTDQTSGVDTSDELIVEVGYGDLDTHPATDPSWSFSAASPVIGWNADDAGAPAGSDGWIGAKAAPGPGLHLGAFRVSGDGGNTWFFCDLDPEKSAFEPGLAPTISSVDGPCWPPVCEEAPTVACEVNVVVERQGEPFCIGLEAGAQCTWPAIEAIEDCGAAGGYCEAGACTGFPGPPGPGEVVISELMIVPPTGESAEWIELTHSDPASLVVYDLEGCTVESADAEVLLISSETPDEGASTLLFPTEHYVLGRSTVGAPALQYGDILTLANSADFVRLSCGGVVIDDVAWDTAAGWEIPVSASLQLGGNQTDAAANDAPGAWCPGSPLGSAGFTNSICPPADADVDGCILESPDGAEVEPGEVFTALGRLFDAGVTDVTSGTDAAPGVVVAFGTGPAGTPPTGPGWSWSPAFPDSFWEDSSAPGEDLWRAPIALSVTGEYDVAMRASADGGASWRLCDLDGSGDYYAGNDYEAEQAGSVAVGAPTCVPNPCNAPPEPSCDGSTLSYPLAGAGVCSIGESAEAVCDYAMGAFDCSHFGGCVDGACVQLPGAPATAGQLVITEVMRDSSLAPPDHGEWIELHNPGAEPLDLRDCTLFDLGGDLFTITGAVPVVAPAGDYFVIGVTSDALVNGGTPVDLAWTGFSLDNIFDEVALSCDGTLIDEITFGLGWPGSPGVAMQLDTTTLDAATNDDPASWCTAQSPYGSSSDLGTPGQPNSPCD